jgi:hypothetical protein
VTLAYYRDEKKMWSPRIVILSLVTVLSLCLGQVHAIDADTCESPNASKFFNSAFVFVKPHANTAATRELVVDKLTQAGIKILSEIDIDGVEIDQKGLIDQHYYSIASKATILSADKIPVPPQKFLEAFGESWEQVLKEKRACNAVEACKRFDCSPAELNEVWQKIELVKFGGGFYCGQYCRVAGILSVVVQIERTSSYQCFCFDIIIVKAVYQSTASQNSMCSTLFSWP